MSKENYVPLTREAFLVSDDGVRLSLGKFELDEDCTVEQFANAAYMANRGSLKKLMVPKYRIILEGPDGQQDSFGLDHWIKLIDHSKAQRLKGGA